MSPIFKFIKENYGVTSMEYALIAVGIAVGIIVVVNLIGTQVVSLYTSVAQVFK
jgi:Flp pilus assembly pilin Flp